MHLSQEGAVEGDSDQEYVQKGRDKAGEEDCEVVGLVPTDVPEGVLVASIYLACLGWAQHLEQGVCVGIQTGRPQVPAGFDGKVFEVDGGWRLLCAGRRGRRDDRIIGGLNGAIGVQVDTQGDQCLSDLAELSFQGVDIFRNVVLDAEVVVEVDVLSFVDFPDLA